MKMSKKGFTLIELIVVIAILAILAALAIPGFLGLREESEQQVCHTNIESLLRGYAVQRALGKTEAPQNSWQKVLDENGSVICPAEGVYAASFDKERLTITCNIHKEGYQQIHGSNFAETLRGTIDQLLADNKITKTSTIDSTAISDDKSRSSVIEKALNEAGFSSVGTTWSVGGLDVNELSVCWAERELPKDAVAGDTMLVIRYNGVRETYTVGYANIIQRKEGNLGLDVNMNMGTSFTEYKDITQTSATKKDFEQTYSIYRQAMEALDKN